MFNRDILFIWGSLLAYVAGAFIILGVSMVIYTVIDRVTGNAIGFFENLLEFPNKKGEE